VLFGPKTSSIEKRKVELKKNNIEVRKILNVLSIITFLKNLKSGKLL
jgi:hypothetical protein